MREIKFRGKRRDNNQITYGDLCIYDDMVFIGIAKTITEIRKDVFVPSVIWYEVEPENVGQFTGILDKNKKEVYEGDIIRFKYVVGDFAWEEMTKEEEKEAQKMNGQAFVGVISSNILTPVNLEIRVGDPKFSHVIWPLIYVQNSEILGNIFENPELLK